jgi:Molybdopterin cofactor-binding domain
MRDASSPYHSSCAAYSKSHRRLRPFESADEERCNRQVRVPGGREFGISAVDAGQVANPDGLRNQIEGAILQSASWTLYESVSFDDTRITSIDWSTYPILRFNAVPDRVDVHIIDRPGLPFLAPAR